MYDLLGNSLKTVKAIVNINVETMCKDWAMSKQKLYQVLYAMPQVGLITIT
ncbi:hypothetical protein NA23_10460 [Fervidobacterium islandicum]|uniref:Uncharacterized protein n=1 Tax=Fervidobacterium islandicum TaxID=2423 RepID=A0AAJ5HNQ6_FERIS|nr:hypothetical protein [Fervidobacterium islandicum]UOE96786.1 hypothetical protein NA23_10460 [Fervidobacterium islandicum]